MTKLNVNVDHIATVRQARGVREPDPVWAAALCELAGADGITCHLRQDRRHIQERDLRLLRQTVKTLLNLEIAPTQEALGIALEIGPNVVTLVPERPEEVTTEGGLSVTHNKEGITNAVRLLSERDIRVSVFVDPDLDQIKTAYESGVKAIEINTTRYCDAHDGTTRRREYATILDASRLAEKLKMHIAAGHALDYKNVGPIAAIPHITELNIGHSIVARAVLVGIERAVREMIEAIRGGRPFDE